ncbi:MAG: hypothetical protein P1P78_10050 [Methyloprofundus sp.]|nr:hypothetical protein [Methyloprofundus sp.]
MTSVNTNQEKSLFNLGETVATPGALEVLKNLNIPTSLLLVRHHAGDWGDLSDGDKEANNQALLSGDQILSAYQFGETRLWVITEHDRSATTILLPEEY